MPEINRVPTEPKEIDVFNRYSNRNKLKVILITSIVAIVAFMFIYIFAKSMLTYTLTYIADGGTCYGQEVKPQEYMFLDKTKLPEGLKKEGYYIAGVYKDPEFKNEYVFGKPIWRSRKLYIDWQPGYAVQLFFAEGEDDNDRSEGNKTGINEKYLKTYYEQYVKPNTEYEVPLVFNDIEKNKHYGEQLIWFYNENGYDNPELSSDDPFETRTFTINSNIKIYGKWFDTNEENYYITEDGTFLRYLGNCYNLKLPSTVKRFKNISNPTQFVSGYWDTSRVYDGTNYSVFDKVMNDLQSVYVNAECEEINSCAFRGCSKLSNVIFAGNNVAKIDQYAFVDCPNLESVVLPSSVTRLETRCFYNSGIRYLTGTENIEYVGDIAFMNSKLVEINLPKVTFIGSSAFAGCYKLQKLVLGGSSVVSTNVTDDSQNVLFWSDYVTIYVPDALIDAYKNTYPWNAYASKIVAKTKD